MDKMDSMFESDPVVSHLYVESFKRKHQLEPEKELMLAILTDAVECLQKHSGSRQATGIKLFQEAKEWIFDENEKEAFSFLNICDALELDPCYIRRGIASLILPRLAHTASKIRAKPAYVKVTTSKAKSRGKWSLHPALRYDRVSRAR